MTPKVSLANIEAAITKNCLIDRSSPKTLMLVKHSGTKNKSLGRVLFLYFAEKAGYNQYEIQDYLMMNDEEYGRRRDKLAVLLAIDHSTDEADRFFHRKRLIIESMLFGVFSRK